MSSSSPTTIVSFQSGAYKIDALKTGKSELSSFSVQLDAVQNTIINDKKFKEELTFSRGMRIKPNFITKSINSMKKMYMEDGYFLADITANTEIVGSAEDQKQNIILIFLLKLIILQSIKYLLLNKNLFSPG